MLINKTPVIIHNTWLPTVTTSSQVLINGLEIDRVIIGPLVPSGRGLLRYITLISWELPPVWNFPLRSFMDFTLFSTENQWKFPFLMEFFAESNLVYQST